ncbi:MAG: ABC transporter permease [Myxococcales bacterium FL481]|nr:MAG: ABC transporter permease [Myxococcales bacterium FL481]
MSELWVVFRKELREALRDRRSLLSAAAFPILGPIMILVMFSNLADLTSEERVLDVAVSGGEHGPALVRHLESQRMEVVPIAADDDPAHWITTGRTDVVVVIPEEYGEAFRAATPAPVEILFDESRQEAQGSIVRVQRAFGHYSSQVGALRLLARGVDPTLTRVLDVRSTNFARQGGVAVRLLSMLPMLVLVSAFLGGMFVAVDTTAGERERGSLEPLLCNPVSRLALVAGKWLASVVFATASLLLMLGLCGVALDAAPLEELGVALELGPRDVAGIVVSAVPLAAFACAVEMLVATFSRSFKEAQTQVSLFMLVPMIPGFWLAFASVRMDLWHLCVPALAQNLLLVELVRGETPAVLDYAVAGASSLVLASLCVVANAEVLKRENVVFGRG